MLRNKIQLHNPRPPLTSAHLLHQYLSLTLTCSSHPPAHHYRDKQTSKMYNSSAAANEYQMRQKIDFLDREIKEAKDELLMAEYQLKQLQAPDETRPRNGPDFANEVRRKTKISEQNGKKIMELQEKVADEKEGLKLDRAKTRKLSEDFLTQTLDSTTDLLKVSLQCETKLVEMKDLVKAFGQKNQETSASTGVSGSPAKVAAVMLSDADDAKYFWKENN